MVGSCAEPQARAMIAMGAGAVRWPPDRATSQVIRGGGRSAPAPAGLRCRPRSHLPQPRTKLLEIRPERPDEDDYMSLPVLRPDARVASVVRKSQAMR